MSILLSSNLVAKMLAIIVSAMYTCLCNNLVQFHRPQDIAIFLAEMIVVGCALISNIDSYLDAQMQ